NCPWKFPPSIVVEQGLDAIVQWWEDKDKSGLGRSSKLKVVLVGQGTAGASKTSLLRHIRDKEAVLPTQSERTVGTERAGTMRFDGNGAADDTKALEVKVWDFAGQEEYYAYHQIFLTKGALYLLVVD
ncbi:unnamed protein product, partial [Chrysoparadoxa australica]